MPCLRKCCFCVNLRVGGIMIGIMTAALALFSIIPTVISLVYRVFLARVITHLSDEYNNRDDPTKTSNEAFIFWGTVSSALSKDNPNLPPENRDSVVWLAGIMYIFFIICIVLLILYFICSILLILAAVKGKRWLMLPWIIATFLFILAYIGGMILSAWLFGFSAEAVFLLIFALIETAIAIYLWICVISLFQVLENDILVNHNWELKPRFTTNYDGVPTEEH